jgi:hypothetical protein
MRGGRLLTMSSDSLNWERLGSDRFEAFRCAVPGGWLVTIGPAQPPDFHPDVAVMGDQALRRIEKLLLRMEEAFAVAESRRNGNNLVFVPDPEHAWDGNTVLPSSRKRLGG